MGAATPTSSCLENWFDFKLSHPLTASTAAFASRFLGASPKRAMIADVVQSSILDEDND
ncbi:hypothetical protein [Aeromicrobium sp.]|uniref:hypothetical protein n=1 Tax=Aeromicrobium sp. TaxID=1871063 RepID=UPI0019C845AC|nr:hypothetical protein [Aeromicrobium sp.]MBC7631189.1 hypothetical protein [Aeromicrobium sp.]